MKTWATIAKTDLSSLDFSKLRVDDADSCITNLAEDTALIKWTGDKPSEVAAINHNELTHNQALVLIATPEWYRDSEGL